MFALSLIFVMTSKAITNKDFTLPFKSNDEFSQKETENNGTWAEHCHSETYCNKINVDKAYFINIDTSKDDENHGWNKVMKKSESKNCNIQPIFNGKETFKKFNKPKSHVYKCKNDFRYQKFNRESEAKSFESNSKIVSQQSDTSSNADSEIAYNSHTTTEKQEYIDAPMPKVNAWGELNKFQDTISSNLYKNPTEFSLMKNVNVRTFLLNESSLGSVEDNLAGYLYYNIFHCFYHFYI